MVWRQRARFGHQWQRSAALLGLLALVVAGLLAEVIAVPSPWRPVVHAATIVIVLVVGTLWLVPASETSMQRRTPE